MTTEGTPPETPPEAPPEGGGDPEVQIDDPKKLYSLYQKKTGENEQLRTRLKETEAKLTQAQEQAMSDSEKAIAKAVKEATTEIETRYQGLLKQERFINRAAGKLTDPSDAVRLVDLDKIGPEDTTAMDEAITELLKAKPYLAAGARVPKVEQGPQGQPIAPNPNDANAWLRKAVTGG